MKDSLTKITEDTKNVTIVDLSGSRNKLTQNMYRVWNIRSSDTKVNNTPYNMMITSRILKRFTIIGHKVNIVLHGSLSSPVISKRSTIKKILNILLLRQKEPLRRGEDLNTKKVSQRAKIRYKKLITKMSLDKSNILRVITSDDHVVHIKKEKGPTMRWHVDKKSWIMSADGKTSGCDHRGKTLKPSPRSLLKAIKGAMKMTNHTLMDRIPRWWMHVNISRSSPLRKIFFTSNWEMYQSQTEATTRRVRIVVIWATGAKVSS
jgi:hypothetical protein